jgi:dihydrofolate synthase/folylpolyglutamate synthase
LDSESDRRAFDEAVQYLSSFTDYEQLMAVAPGRCTFDLTRLERLLALLDHPERCAPVVHITGTKGKTSTTWMTEAILRAHGLRTFRFTSPHVESLHERLAISNRAISNREFAAIMSRLRPLLETIRTADPNDLPSFFELMTVMGFLHCRDKGAEVQVIEVGLGGRLDATNVVDPAVSVITSVALDHERILGSTIPAIAFEKAGILKPGRPAVIGLEDGHPGLPVVLERAKKLGVRVYRRGHELEVLTVQRESDRTHGPFLRASVRILDQKLEGMRLHAGADHQAWNALYALAASQIALQHCGQAFDASKAFDGLAALKTPARAEWFPGKPPLLLDGAHTKESLADLAQVALCLAAGEPLVALMGLTRDRDASVLLPLASQAKHSVLVPLPTPRSGNPKEQAIALESHKVQVEACASIPEGLRIAQDRAGRSGLVVVGGSLYLAGAVRRLLRPSPP